MVAWLRRLTAVPALVVFLVQVELMHHAMMGHTGGQPSYPVDDAFIHLSLAKHIVQDGVFGVSPHAFASTSSSIGWPWLLAAAMRVVGNDAWLPLWFNVAFGACVPFVVDWVARAMGGPELGALRRMFLGAFVVFLTPLPTLAVIGMEHTLHVLAMIAFVAASAMHVAEPARFRRAVPLLAAAAVAVRYESLFAIGCVAALLAARRELGAAARVAIGAAIPVVAFGAYSKLHGGHFLPTSVLLKGRPIELHSATDAVDMFGGDVLHHLSQEAHLLVLGVAASWLGWWSMRERGLWAAGTVALVVCFVNLVAHIELAGLGWFYRYDSYLVAMLVTVVGVVVGSAAPRTTWPRMKTWSYWAAIAAGVVTFGPMLPRVLAAAKTTPSAGGNIFDQQMQTARFLERYFPSDVAAINDIGAVTYLRDGPIVDLVGLADEDVAKAKHYKLDTPLKPEDVVRFTQGAHVAVLYDDWFHGLVPKSWFRVAQWKIPNNVSCAYPTVSIYATKPEDVARVVAAAHAFAALDLPSEVRTSGYASEADRGIAAGDVVELTAPDDARTVGVVDPDGTLPIEHVGDIVVRGLEDGDVAVTASRKPVGRVRRLAPHAPRVCVTGAVRLSFCTDASLALDGVIAAADPLPTARIAEAFGWREQDGALVRVTRVAFADGLRDRDIVVVP